MKILVTGATGFIGRYVVPELIHAGHEVIASSSGTKKLTSADLQESATYVPFDLRQFDPLVNYFDLFHRPDAMIHLAWEGLPNYSAPFHISDNFPRHLAFLNNMIDHGLMDLSVSGTCFEYGLQEGRLHEGLPALPQNAYAVAKNKLRLSLEQLQKKKPFILRWLRMFYMYGKGQNENSLFSQLDKAIDTGEPVFNMSGGEQVRDYLPVESMATRICQVSLQKTITGIVNCCSGRPVKLKELVQGYISKRKSSIQLNLGYYPYSKHEPMSFWGDLTKLNLALQSPDQ